MIINSNNLSQRNILANKCFYKTTSQIVYDLEQKGYQNATDEAAKIITAYHEQKTHRFKSFAYNNDYKKAFSDIDQAIETIANQLFYTYDSNKENAAYDAFKKFDYIRAILGYYRQKKMSIQDEEL